MRTVFALLAATLAASSPLLAQTPPRRPPMPSPSSPSAAQTVKPDLILFDGVIYTGVGFDDDKPQVVSAIAIGGGKVLAVGLR